MRPGACWFCVVNLARVITENGASAGKVLCRTPSWVPMSEWNGSLAEGGQSVGWNDRQMHTGEVV